MWELWEMSQASKQVDWCLNKAKKEIDECRRLNIRERHRGLIEVDSNVGEAKKHIEKAESNLKSALDFIKMGYSDWSVSAFFYSAYHCFLSIATKFGYESGNQNCTISLIEYLNEQGKIKLENKFLEAFKYETQENEKSVIGMREDYTYGTRKEVSKDKIEWLTKLCKELIDETKNIILV